ncbi:MAG: response regulator [Thermomicrobia bacterium]|nr:response regulator [Thermomicrobia bacterium]
MATILVAGDESPIVALLRDLFEGEGHCVLAAYNDREALEFARSAHPDLVLSDLMMPLMDGMQLALTLHDGADTRLIAVSLMSAHRLPERETFGVAAFVAQPFDLDLVVRLVAWHLAA